MRLVPASEEHALTAAETGARKAGSLILAINLLGGLLALGLVEWSNDTLRALRSERESTREGLRVEAVQARFQRFRSYLLPTRDLDPWIAYVLERSSRLGVKILELRPTAATPDTSEPFRLAPFSLQVEGPLERIERLLAELELGKFPLRVHQIHLTRSSAPAHYQARLGIAALLPGGAR